MGEGRFFFLSLGLFLFIYLWLLGFVGFRRFRFRRRGIWILGILYWKLGCVVL